jgi:hypothetical protein
LKKIALKDQRSLMKDKLKKLSVEGSAEERGSLPGSMIVGDEEGNGGGTEATEDLNKTCGVGGYISLVN